MNAQKYTQKSLEAIQAAQQLTIENQNQQIEQVHLLASLIRQENGLAPQLLRKMGVTVESLDAAVLQELGKLPPSFPASTAASSTRATPTPTLPNGRRRHRIWLRAS